MTTWFWILGALLFGCFVVGLRIVEKLEQIAGLIRLFHNELAPNVDSISMDLHSIASDTLAIKRLAEKQREDPAIEFLR